MSWGKKLAKIWLNYVPPSRPSYSELCIYTRYLNHLQRNLRRKIKLLILGSTVEFRDWGYEHLLDVTVIDFSYDYYIESSLGARHRNIHEKIVTKRWEEMAFESKFDVIIGDLAIGNLQSSKVESFLDRASKSLTENGLFMTKSLFKKNNKNKSLEEIFNNYYKYNSYCHPFSAVMYDMNFACMNNQSELLNFRLMWNKISEAYKAGIIKEETYKVFSKLGWQDNMKFKFYIPHIDVWEDMIQRYFRTYNIEYGDDIYSQDIPLYIMFKNR